MDDYPRWDELGPSDRLRIAALEAEIAGISRPFLQAMLVAADLLEEFVRRGDQFQEDFREFRMGIVPEIRTEVRRKNPGKSGAQSGA